MYTPSFQFELDRSTNNGDLNWTGLETQKTHTDTETETDTRHIYHIGSSKKVIAQISHKKLHEEINS